MQHCLRCISSTEACTVQCGWCLNREYKVEVRDSSFQPQIIVIEEGDRIWWEWTKDKVTMMIISASLSCHVCRVVCNFFTSRVFYHRMLRIITCFN